MKRKESVEDLIDKILTLSSIEIKCYPYTYIHNEFYQLINCNKTNENFLRIVHKMLYSKLYKITDNIDERITKLVNISVYFSKCYREIIDEKYDPFEFYKQKYNEMNNERMEILQKYLIDDLVKLILQY